MKSLRYFLTMIMIISLVGIMSCGKKPNSGPSLTDQQKQAQLLEGTWTADSVVSVPNGIDPSVVSSLALTFNVDNSYNPTSFSASGAPDFFVTQSSSTWSWSSTSTTVIGLANTTPVTSLQINSLSNGSLKLTFTYTSTSQRVQKLDGNYQITFSK